MTDNQTIEQEKPSEMIRFALQALREAEKPGAKVKPDMDDWHSKDETGQCFACLGGLASNKRFGFNPDLYVSNVISYLKQLGDDVYRMADPYENALDCFRRGRVSWAFATLHLGAHKGAPFNREITDYENNREQFHNDMNQLADDLEAAGY